jgi:hypothetical protein
MMDVTVKVPEDRLGEFFLMYGQWLQGLGNGESGSAERLEWTITDETLAGEFVRKLPESGRRFLDLMISTGEMNGRSIVGPLGLNEVTQLPGVHGWIGRVSKAFGRKNPIKARPTADGTIWWVEPPVAELFERVKG